MKVNDDEIRISELYFKLIDLSQNTEEIRWTRLNNLLLIDAIFLAAWASVVQEGDISYYNFILAFLCLPGFFLSIIWANLGARTSLYHKYYNRKAKLIERRFANEAIKIVTTADRYSRRIKGELSRSTRIVVYVPRLFAAIFFLLLIISFFLKSPKVG